MNELLGKAATNIGCSVKIAATDDEPKIRVNESIGRAAFFYEKLRNTLDYQEEHLFLKNAIKRILRRRILSEAEKPRRLLHELVWARYFKNETIPVATIDEVGSILRKYAFLRKHARSSRKNRAFELFLGFAACEIEELLNPSSGQSEYLEFTAGIFKRKITIPATEVEPALLDQQITIAIELLLFKSDPDQIYFHLFKSFYPDWPDIDKDQARELSKNLDQILNNLDEQIKRGRSSKVFKFIKRNIPPFIIIYQVINENKTRAVKITEDKKLLHDLSLSVIERKNRQTFGKVLRSLWRGILFILFTKIVLAFLIEFPYERDILGAINYTALAVNISLPPLLMFLTGIFIRVPGAKNTYLISKMISEIMTKGDLPGKSLGSIARQHSRGYLIFNFVYTLMSLAIIAAVVYLLIDFKFNIVSIALFFFFVSIVSFLAFRIRATAKELEVRQDDEGIINGIFSFILLPFVIIGKYLSDVWSNYNFTLWFWDFVIEAPFKTIIGLFENWLSFVREKREDFE